MDKNHNTKTYFRQATQLLRQKRFQEATLKCAKAISLDPNNASAYVDWATALFGLKCLDKAAIKLNRALKIDPNYARAHYNLGLLNYHLGSYEEAQKNFKSLKDTFPQLHLYWGMSFLNQGKYFEAMMKWEIIIANNPKTIFPYIYICMSLFSQGKYSEARVFYEKALKIQQPMQTRAQIVESLNKDMTLTETKFHATQDEKQKEYYHKKMVAILFYLNKIMSEWPQY